MDIDGPGPFENSHGNNIYGKIRHELEASPVGWGPIRSMLSLGTKGKDDVERYRNCCEQYAAAAFVAIVCSPQSPMDLPRDVRPYSDIVEPQPPERSIIDTALAALDKIETASILREHWAKNSQLPDFVKAVHQYRDRLTRTL